MTNTVPPRIIIHDADPEPLAAEVAERHGDAELATSDSYDGLPDLIEAFRPDIVYSIRFAGTPGFPRDALLGAKGPKWIANGGSGVDHLRPWDPARVTVTNSAGVAADMMAEYVMGGLLHFFLDVPGLTADQLDRRWTARKVVPIAGKTLLIIGLGNTGRAIATRAKAFGMNVIGVRARPKPDRHADEVHGMDDIAALWPRADAIAVCAPLLESTRAMLDADAFAAMKPGVVLADISRGGIMVEADLVEALRSGRVRGATLDVFETEPLPAGNPLWGMKNVLISPHCSSVYDGWEIASVRQFCGNLDRWRAGEPLFNVVDPERGY